MRVVSSNFAWLRRDAATIVLASVITVAATSSQAPDGGWTRLNQGNPILSPTGDGFESAGVFNPAVIKADRKFVRLYRAQDKAGTSRRGR